MKQHETWVTSLIGQRRFNNSKILYSGKKNVSLQEKCFSLFLNNYKCLKTISKVLT